MREIEWRPGSGRSANYSDGEQELVRSLVRKAESGDVPAETIQREIDTFHDIKFEFDAVMVEDEPRQEPVPVQESMFQVPPKAQRILDVREER